MMTLEIISPGKKIFSGKVKLVQVPGKKGAFEILNNHAPIISTLSAGKVKIVTPDDEKNFFDITGGVVEVANNNIIILVNG
ncbi:MAG: ATP synthase F1 subunit epsilon [Bacteroidales bacterium]|nr:ATP synthase F1 subunit epsilon [Bacteroidales bacterium]HOK98420.1 ATP synthase F1 subunit epsilon [Bacteroidales bacterium]